MATPSAPDLPSGLRIWGLSLGSKSPTRGHVTHYVTGDQHRPAIPPFVLAGKSMKPPKGTRVLQLEGSRATACSTVWPASRSGPGYRKCGNWSARHLPVVGRRAPGQWCEYIALTVYCCGCLNKKRPYGSLRFPRLTVQSGHFLCTFLSIQLIQISL